MQKVSGDIVDCVVGIMDDRPEPMRNFKPAQRIKNGLEKFWATHQEQYESWGRSSGSRVKRVHRHNAAYPKMIDELDRRRSMTRVTVNNNKKKMKFKRDSLCYSCIKKERLRNRNARATPKSRYRHLSSRIKKKTKNKRRKNPSFSKNTASQCAYVIIKDKNIATDTIFKMDSKINVNLSVLTDRLNCLKRAGKKPKVASKPQSKSMNSSRNPDTSIASMSSYNSFATLDQEPMV